MCAQGALVAAGANAIHYYAHRTDGESEREGCCMNQPIPGEGGQKPGLPNSWSSSLY